MSITVGRGAVYYCALDVSRNSLILSKNLHICFGVEPIKDPLVASIDKIPLEFKGGRDLPGVRAEVFLEDFEGVNGLVAGEAGVELPHDLFDHLAHLRQLGLQGVGLLVAAEGGAEGPEPGRIEGDQRR